VSKSGKGNSYKNNAPRKYEDQSSSDEESGEVLRKLLKVTSRMMKDDFNMKREKNISN
jgi:hypothetical protein